MRHTSRSVESLVEQFTKLPTIGRKTAQRLASYILKMPREEVALLANALLDAKDKVRQCTSCFNITDADPCPICVSSKRDRSTICVVEESNDVLAVERTNEFRGLYHVLGGAISPLDGIGPDDLRIRELVARVSGQASHVGVGVEGASTDAVAVTEVILAMNPNVEGDTTAYYLSQILAPFNVRVTRIARGLPIGGDLEYADEATLSRAFEGRLSL